MRPRIFAPETLVTGALIRLPDEEARHVNRVLRSTVGDEVSVFDGRGHECIARIESVSRAGVFVRGFSPAASAPELSTEITVAQAVLKGDGMDDVVRDAVMIGASTIVPLTSARTEVPQAALARGGRIDRWQRIALASAKQCGRAVVPVVRPLAALDPFLDDVADGTKLIFVEPSMLEHVGEAQVEWARLARPARATIAIGPEGGWTREEIEHAVRAGYRACSLGGLTLRAERAALVALSTLRFLWQA